MRHFVLLAPLLLATAAAPAAGQRRSDAPLPRIQGLLYPEARTRLLRAGWRPAEQPGDPTNPDLASGNGPYFVAHGYRELVSCSGTGLAYCRFAFRNNGRVLTVITAGEVPQARVRRARIEPGRGRD